MFCSLEGSKFQVPEPRALRGLKLVSLTWDDGEFSDTWLEVLGMLCLPLGTINLRNCSGLFGIGLGGLLKLTSVTLKGCQAFSDEGLAVVCTLPLLARLELLEMFRQKLTTKGLFALAGAKHLEHLVLHSGNQVGGDFICSTYYTTIVSVQNSLHLLRILPQIKV